MGKGKMKEETALTMNWVSDSIDRCHIGFLLKAYVPHAKLWDGVLCQVVFVRSTDEPSPIVPTIVGMHALLLFRHSRAVQS
jgi:hypothetical protein